MGAIKDGTDAQAFNRDAGRLRGLARQYSEIASLPIMQKRRRRMTDNNDLKTGRPPVLLHELPWHELGAGGKLALSCETGFARQIELRFRRALYQWEYFPGDMYFEPAFTLAKEYSSTGNGVEAVENALRTDEKNEIYSHEYIDQLETERDLEKFKMPVVTAYPERDAERAELAAELLGGELAVELRGADIYHAPWDNIARYRSVTRVMVDLCDRPGHMHAIMDAYTRAAVSEYEQMEGLGLLECRNTYLHCTPQFTSAVPAADHRDGGPYRFKDVWFRSMAQMFADVSPSMHEEFDVLYGKRLADRCALTYYGCCEPLHNKIAMLKKNLPNLRKIGVTPWADEEKCAEQIRGGYVYAKKPNPANVAIKADPAVIRAETVKTVELCQKYGCPYEFVLKDVSTVSYRPENLTIWENTVRGVLDAYYGAEQ